MRYQSIRTRKQLGQSAGAAKGGPRHGRGQGAPTGPGHAPLKTGLLPPVLGSGGWVEPTHPRPKSRVWHRSRRHELVRARPIGGRPRCLVLGGAPISTLPAGFCEVLL